MKETKKILICLVLLFLHGWTNGQTLSYLKSVLVQASVQNNPPAIQLTWNQDFNASEVFIYKRTYGEKNWGAPISTLPGSSESFYDIQVQEGVVYEYQVERKYGIGGNILGHGYITSAVEFEGFEFRGKQLIIVENNLLNALQAEIEQYRLDQILSGYEPLVFGVDQTSSVEDIKNLILEETDDPDHTAVWILGDVAVPYSGNVFPDGIPQHKGAWPCDGYYGELDGTWTDNSVFITLNDDRQDNIPADGKFDQSFFPSDVDLPVSRVDFSNLSENFDQEIEWTRAYLQKVFQFKREELSANKSCILQDQFDFVTEAFAQNAWKNVSPLTEASPIEEGSMKEALLEDSYLIAYGNGTGTFDNCEGVISTPEFLADSLAANIYIMYGSYFGDWDSPDNLLMASLVNGNGLLSVWAGRPHWQIHSMGMGYPVGNSLVRTQNNVSTDYQSGLSAREIHISLLGDPTLSLYPRKPITGLNYVEQNGDISLSWEPYDAPNILAYHIYAVSDNSLEFLGEVSPNENTFLVECVPFELPVDYVVRAKLLEITPSGSFHNYSLGASIEVLNTQWDWTCEAQFDYTQENGVLSFDNQSIQADYFQWNIDGSFFDDSETPPSYVGNIGDMVTVELIVGNACDADTLVTEILINTLETIVRPKIEVSPNPFEDYIHIQSEVSALEVVIYDSKGNQIPCGITTDGIIDLSTLKPGVYALVCYNATGWIAHTEKLIKL